MTVFTFRFQYSINDDIQERYVVADSEESAWEKILLHFEQMHLKGFAKPYFITDPTVEFDNVII